MHERISGPRAPPPDLVPSSTGWTREARSQNARPKKDDPSTAPPASPGAGEVRRGPPILPMPSTPATRARPSNPIARRGAGPRPGFRENAPMQFTDLLADERLALVAL